MYFVSKWLEIEWKELYRDINSCILFNLSNKNLKNSKDIYIYIFACT